MNLVRGNGVEDIDLAAERERELAAAVATVNGQFVAGAGVHGFVADVVDDATSGDASTGVIKSVRGVVANVGIVDGLGACGTDAGGDVVVVVDLVGHGHGLGVGVGVSVHWRVRSGKSEGG